MNPNLTHDKIDGGKPVGDVATRRRVVIARSLFSRGADMRRLPLSLATTAAAVAILTATCSAAIWPPSVGRSLLAALEGTSLQFLQRNNSAGRNQRNPANTGKQQVPRQDNKNDEAKKKRDAEAEKRAREAKAREAALASVLRRAKGLVINRKIGEAVAVIAPYATESGDSEAAKGIAALIAQLSEKAGGEMKLAETQLTSNQPIAGAMTLVAVRRVYGKLPEVDTAVSAELTKLAGAESTRNLLEQAEALDRGQAAEAALQNRLALVAYQSVVSKYARTDAAKIAQSRIDVIESKTSAATSTEADPEGEGSDTPSELRTWKDATGKFQVQARLVDRVGDQVRLETSQGRVISVPVDKLSEADQQFLADR